MTASTKRILLNKNKMVDFKRIKGDKRRQNKMPKTLILILANRFLISKIE